MASKTERFFTWVWRINGLVLLLVVLCVGGGLAATLIGSIFFHAKPQAAVQQIAGADLHSEELRLEEFHSIEGTDFLCAYLGDVAKMITPTGVLSYSGGGGSYVNSGIRNGYGSRNVLFFDLTNKKAHWLFPKNDQDIQALHFAYDPPYKETDYMYREQTHKKTVAVIVEFAQRRSSQEKEKSVPHMLAVADVGGKNVNVVLSAIDRLLGYQQPDGKTILLFYVSAGVAKVMDYNLETRSVISDNAIATDAP
jgi:hypothetical protein